METAPLKPFATWARTALIREVTARVAVVLAPASPERVEQLRAVEALEEAVNAAGSGDKGRAAVADRVAYTWFNRIIALRFMDANGYTGTGVVSPQAGVESGQPEILAEAKRGNIDATVVSTKTRETVMGLLNGTRRSEGPQGEAYALLLADYCRYWNRAMPFMFEREGDFTELLIPANLLADDSVLNRAVKVLTTDVCQDVEVIGWLYQFYISERKDEVFAGFKKNKKAGAAEIPAATQLFTPHWIVRYLVENSLGRLWMLNRPSSRLVDQMEYYIALVDDGTDFLKISSPEEVKVIDPACGSGHMLTYAFDLLYAIYEEEGYSPSEIPRLILSNNLYGVEIDPRAGALAAFALTMKARARQRTFFNRKVEPNVCVLEPIYFTPQELDLLLTAAGDRHEEIAFWNQFEHAYTVGSLIQPDPELTAHLGRHVVRLDDAGDLLMAGVVERAERVVAQAEYLLSRYNVLVANPPYMGRGNMGSLLTDFVDANYPTTSWGLDASFIARADSLVLASGFSALVTMQSWMYLSSYEQFRRHLLTRRSIAALAHLGTGVFESFGGEVVAVVATVFRHSSAQTHGSYIRLLGLRSDSERRDEFRAAALSADHPKRFSRMSADFLSLRGALVAYFADNVISEFLASAPIRNYVEAGVGSQTGANERFVRYWFEVSHGDVNLLGREGVDQRKWTPSTKGGEFRRWYNTTMNVMDWRGNGTFIKEQSPGAVIRNASLYFRENLSWTKVGSRIPSFRFSDSRTVHNDASCFVVSRGVPLDSVSAYLNSRTVTSLIKELNPTLNLRPASLLDFPFVEVSPINGKLCREISKHDWDRQELSLDYSSSPLVMRWRGERLADTAATVLADDAKFTSEFTGFENAIEREVAAAAGLPQPDEIPCHEHSLLFNPPYRYGPGRTAHEYEALARTDLIRDFISYTVGCMFGRYSLDEPGLILADQAATVRDYLVKVPNATFMPDSDNVLPIVDGDWFADDIVACFRKFLRAAFGEQHFEENLRFVTESLGVKDIRDYFVKSFYKDHVQRYKKRPIYWLFSSPNGSFNALIYMHRYTPSTVSTVLNEYLREFRAKLTSSLQQQERLAASGGTPRQQAAAEREADRLRKVLLELEGYEHDLLYPLASRQLSIDLDDGVKVNYPKFGAALKRIPGLEASDE
jgi:hypothetical protein